MPILHTLTPCNFRLSLRAASRFRRNIAPCNCIDSTAHQSLSFGRHTNLIAYSSQAAQQFTMLLYPEVGLSWCEVPESERERYEANAASYWDCFYKKNADKFYKDRHYFDREFPELLNGPALLLEVGCGAGNTVYPLLELNPQLSVAACDFSPRAVQIVQAHPSYASGRVKAFVADITSFDLRTQVAPASADFVTMVFVLSAISPERMHDAIANVAGVLKRGSGKLLFRDYARGDLAQDKHQSTGNKRLAENFYVRGDGTRCYYFEEGELAQLFAAHGFRCVEMKMHERDVDNHKRQITMHRRWVQAIFQLDGSGATGPCAAPAAPLPCSRGQGGGQSQAHSHTSAHTVHTSPPLGPDPMEEEHAPVGGSWLVGAAGRLVTGLNAPGVPSGRAQLPLSLESADELAQSLSPFKPPVPTPQIEEQLDREFFDIIARDTEEVVQEELAAAACAGISAIRLSDPTGHALSPPALSPSSTTNPLAGNPAHQPGLPPPAAVYHGAPAGSDHAPRSPATTAPSLGLPGASEVEVRVAPSLSVCCSLPLLEGVELEFALASLLAQCPRLVDQRSVLELEAGSSGIAAIAGVRAARRVVAAHSRWPPADALSRNLRLNSPRVVVERLRACPLDLCRRAEEHVPVALRQAPESPGCFDLVVSAGLAERCLRDRGAHGAAALPAPGGRNNGVVAGGWSAGHAVCATGGGSGSSGDRPALLAEALRAARALVTAQQRAPSLQSVRPFGPEPSGHDRQGWQGQGQGALGAPGQGQGLGQAAGAAAPGALCVLVERAGVLGGYPGLLDVAACAGWAPVATEGGDPRLAEILAWKAKLDPLNPQGQFEVLVLVPL